MTLAELRAFLDQMINLPCAMHQIGDVKVRRCGLKSAAEGSRGIRKSSKQATLYSFGKLKVLGERRCTNEKIVSGMSQEARFEGQGYEYRIQSQGKVSWRRWRRG
jgi:hypothetical protein